MQVHSLFRYPVKGLSGERLQSVTFEPDCGLPGDRRFAIVHAKSQYDERSPGWLHRRNFVVRAHSPGVAALATAFDPETRKLMVTLGERCCELDVDSASVNDDLSDLLNPLTNEKQPGPFRLIEFSAGSLTDSPEETISLLNTRSLADLEDKTGLPLHIDRFRGNIWYNGEQPWEERKLAGKTIAVGNVLLQVTEQIVRCAAINVHPNNGGYDLDLLTRLGRQYGHVHFGVLARVLKRGRISIGNDVVFDCENYKPDSLGIN